MQVKALSPRGSSLLPSTTTPFLFPLEGVYTVRELTIRDFSKPSILSTSLCSPGTQVTPTTTITRSAHAYIPYRARNPQKKTTDDPNTKPK